jgi:hypothetical protein
MKTQNFAALNAILGFVWILKLAFCTFHLTFSVGTNPLSKVDHLEWDDPAGSQNHVELPIESPCRRNCGVYINECPSGNLFLDVILRSPANSGTTKNLMVSLAAEILRGFYPEPAEGLRMTCGSFRVDTK